MGRGTSARGFNICRDIYQMNTLFLDPNLLNIPIKPRFLSWWLLLYQNIEDIQYCVPLRIVNGISGSFLTHRISATGEDLSPVYPRRTVIQGSSILSMALVSFTMAGMEIDPRTMEGQHGVWFFSSPAAQIRLRTPEERFTPRTWTLDSKFLQKM